MLTTIPSALCSYPKYRFNALKIKGGKDRLVLPLSYFENYH